MEKGENSVNKTSLWCLTILSKAKIGGRRLQGSMVTLK